MWRQLKVHVDNYPQESWSEAGLCILVSHKDSGDTESLFK